MRRVALLAVALATSIGPAQPPGPEPGSAWLLVAHVKARRIAIDPADPGSQTELADREPRGELSPDGSRVVFPGSPDDGGVALFIADVADETPHRTRNTRQVTRAMEHVADAHWLADGRHLVFTAAAEGRPTVHLIDTAEDKPTLRRLSAPGEQAHNPRPGPRGLIAYRTVTTDRKPQPGDLLLADADTGERRTLLRDRPLITSIRWSPDGTRIACSTAGSLIIVGPADGSFSETPYTKIDASLTSHFAGALALRPDGRLIALRAHFAGGTAEIEGAPAPPPPPWETLVYMVPVEGGRPDPAAASAIPGPPHIFELSWIAAGDTD